MVAHSQLAAAVAAMLLASIAARADTSESLMTRSRAAEKVGKAVAAERLASFYYSEALEIEPENIEAQHGLAQVARAQKQETAAAEGNGKGEH
jgi:hypothetical protein